MLRKMRGFLLRTVKYSDSSLILDLYTREAGICSFIVSGVRGNKSRNPAALFQIASCLDLEVYFREGRSLNRIREARPARIFNRIPYEVKPGAVVQYMVELLRNVLREEGVEESLYDFIDECMLFVDRSRENISLFPCWFAWKLTSRLGFGPNLEDWSMDYLDLHSGRFLPQPPDHPHYISPPESEMLVKLLACNMEEIHQLEINRMQRNELLELAHRYYHYHQDNFREMRSPDILTAVFR